MPTAKSGEFVNVRAALHDSIVCFCGFPRRNSLVESKPVCAIKMTALSKPTPSAEKGPMQTHTPSPVLLPFSSPSLVGFLSTQPHIQVPTRAGAWGGQERACGALRGRVLLPGLCGADGRQFCECRESPRGGRGKQACCVRCRYLTVWRRDHGMCLCCALCALRMSRVSTRRPLQIGMLTNAVIIFMARACIVLFARTRIQCSR